MALYARPSLSGWEQGDDAAAFSRPSLSTWEQLDAPSGPATAITLTGPSSGVVGVASSDFTVGANGTITGTVEVTPSDGGDGGTFTPTSVEISNGTPTATFTYTPASVGAPTATITVTNDGGLTNPSGIDYTATAADVPITFAGTIPTITFTIGTADDVDLSSYFSGTETPFTFDLDALSAALPSGVTLSSAGLLEWSGSGTAATTADVIVEGEDTNTDVDSSNPFDIVVQDAPTGENIRLVIGGDYDEGGQFASQTLTRWWLFSADGTTLLHTGAGSTSSTGGVFTIDIDDAAVSVGTNNLRWAGWLETGETDPADRTVTLGGGYVNAVAQV